METPPVIAFKGIEPTPSLRSRIEREIDQMEHLFGRIVSCHVVLEAPGKRHHHGNLYQARVHLTLPDGREVVVDRNPSADHAHEDAMVAIRDVFHAAQRQLQDEARKMRHKVKHHDLPPVARVKEIYPLAGYGFLMTDDDRMIYFHRNSVLDEAFDRLTVGLEVSFVEEMGRKGPQASTVRILGKHGMRPSGETGL